MTILIACFYTDREGRLVLAITICAILLADLIFTVQGF